MFGSPPRTSRQPKLRSSCDGCGTAKVRCDRGLPECDRCISLGLLCVYGVSRKMGKPPREKVRIPRRPSVSSTSLEYAGRIYKEITDVNSFSSGTGGSADDGSTLNAGQFSEVNDIPSVWGVIDDYSNITSTATDAPDVLQNDLLGPPLPDFTSLDFGDNFLSNNVDTEAVSILQSSTLDSSSTSTAQGTASPTQIDEIIYLDGTFMSPERSNNHDCFKEAFVILGGLSFFTNRKSPSVPSPTLGPASATASAAHDVPLDHILRLNRESSERLGRLLNCSCAKCPHLALLYASIVSRILYWYQQSAGCSLKASWDPSTATIDELLSNTSHSRSTSGFSSPWSSTTATTVNTGGTNTPVIPRDTALSVAPMQMAIGSFAIDDQRVQTALRIQLILGEIGRTGCLIDQFTSWKCSSADESASSSVNGLYKSLGSWLRGEHSRIADVMRSKLREVST